MSFYLHKLIKTFSRTERIVFAGALLVLVTSSLIYGANYIESKTKLVPAQGGIYREAVVGQPVYVNPVISNANEADRDLISLIYSNAYDLADKVSVSQNKLIWTLRLKNNLYWHDRQRLTADDIVFTIEKIQDPEARSPLFVTWQGVIPERVSELELTLTTGAPYAFFEDNLKSLYIVPKHVYQNVPVANWRQSDYNLEPIGSGPYKPLSFKKERNGFVSEYRLAKNDSYFKGVPYIDGITFLYFTAQDEAIRAFNTARVDAVSGVDPIDLKNVKRPGQVMNLRLPRYYAAFFNPNSSSLLSDKNVRLALNYATNKKEIIDKVWNNYAASVDNPMPITQGAGGSGIIPYDQQTASNLLNQKLKKDRDGFYGEIKLVVPQLRFLLDTANLLKSQWEAVGIKTTLIVLDPITINNDIIKTRNYDAILFGNIFANNPDMFSFWHSSERFYPGLNLSLYNSKTADRLMETIRNNFDNQSRAQQFASLGDAISADSPAVFLYSPNYIYVANSKIQGIDERIISIPSNRFGNIEKWFVETRRVLAK